MNDRSERRSAPEWLAAPLPVPPPLPPGAGASDSFAGSPAAGSDRRAEAARWRVWLDQAGSVALALVLAVMVWLGAKLEGEPLQMRSAADAGTDAVPISFHDVPAGRAVFDPSVRTARLDLRGLKEGLPKFGPRDFEVWADLSGAGPSSNEVVAPLRWTCKAGCTRAGVRVDHLQPSAVTVRLGPEITLVVPVDANQLNLPSASDSVDTYAVTASFDPPTVTLRGAVTNTTRVTRAVARMPTNAAELGTTLEPQNGRYDSLNVVAVDANGEPIPEVWSEPATVSATLRFERRGIEVSVRADVRGELAEGYVLDGWKVEPKWVKLEGPPEALQQIDAVTTAAVDYSRFTEDRSVRVPLRLPRGVLAVNAPDGVTVTVQVVAPGSATFDVPVQIDGVGPGLAGTVSPGNVKVLLGGTEDELRRLQPSDIKAYVDLTGKVEGRHRVTVEIAPLSGGLRRRSITPEEVEVVLRAEDPGHPLPTPTATAVARR